MLHFSPVLSKAAANCTCGHWSLKYGWYDSETEPYIYLFKLNSRASLVTTVLDSIGLGQTQQLTCGSWGCSAEGMMYGQDPFLLS